MKRSEFRKLEKELRLLALDETQLDPERDAQMTAWVKEQYELAMEEKAKKPVRENKIGRRILAISATAVFLLVLSFAYTVFMPEAVSNAKGYIHKVTIWANDVLHLGFEVDVPSEEYKQGNMPDTVYYSFEDAAAAHLPHPLVYMQHPDVELLSIAVKHEFQIPEAIITYRYESIDFTIDLVFTGDDYFTRLNDFDGQVISWEKGEFTYWEHGTYRGALTYYAGMEIIINMDTTIALDTFIELCQSLAIVI